MLNIRTLWIAAVAEMRSCCRLVRTWLFIAVSVLFCTLWFEIVPGTHLFYMNGIVLIFPVGLILLAFDIRKRDVKYRTSEVVDSQTDSTVEIIFGRIAGILLLVLMLCLVLLLTAIVSILSGTFFRLDIPSVTVLSHIAWNLIPNLIFCSALVACLIALFRFRLLIAAIALGVFLGLFWIGNLIPVKLQESLSLFPSNTLVTSDLVPTLVTPAIIGNKFVVLLVSSALLFFSASILTRAKRERVFNVVSGVSAMGVACVILFVMIGGVYLTENLKEEWLIEHRQYDSASFPDVQDLTGTIELLPGRKIILDVTLSVHPSREHSTESVVFSLNPGYSIHSVYIDGELTTKFNFEAGILELPSDILPEFSHEIRVQAEGKT